MAVKRFTVQYFFAGARRVSDASMRDGANA